MEGSELITLSQMFAKDPVLHQKYLEKYKGREEILERRIPLLDCLWNDVVQLLPLHPRKLFEMQLQLGLISEIPEYRYFQVDPTILNSHNSAVYFKTAPGEENVSVQWLRDINLEDLQEVPSATIKYYESMVGSGEPVFNYQFVPHILHRGSIDISESRVIGIAK